MVVTPPRSCPADGRYRCPADRTVAVDRADRITRVEAEVHVHLRVHARGRVRGVVRDPDPVAEAPTLWRMRTTVQDAPGSLAALCTALAGYQVDILSLQTHPLAEGTVDEFLLRAPGEVAASEITRAVSSAGGSGTWIERADAHDLVDAPTRVLGLATRTALDAAELPLALRQLLGRCTIRSLPATTAAKAREPESVPVEGALEDTVMRLRAPEGGVITVERAYLPFTPTEFARARALVELDARLGPRIPCSQDVLTLPEGNAITVRRADTGDLDAAREMHERCSARTLGMRYHGPVGDADRYLNHLLSPRFRADPRRADGVGADRRARTPPVGRGRDGGSAAGRGRLATAGYRERVVGAAGGDGCRGGVRERVRRDAGVQHGDGRGDAGA